MEIVLYCLAALAAGFLLAWFVKPAASNTAAYNEQLTAFRIQAATDEQQKKRLLHDVAELNSQLQQRAAEFSSQLQQRIAEFSSQLQQRTAELQKSDLKVVELMTRLETRDYELSSVKTELQSLSASALALGKDLRQREREVHELQVKVQMGAEQQAMQATELQKIGQQFTKEFESLAHKVLEEKTSRFDKHQEKSLSDILAPLKENIRQFKTDFEAKYSKESDERISLREQIKHMMELNQTLSTQANNLTNALRGQVKQQGNWGEMILESILEYADLQKGIHYFVQEHTAGEDGQSLYPDIIVRYPDNRSIVIDSKVSLLHYEQYVSGTTVEAQVLSLKGLTDSVYKHIDGLSSKKYQDAVGSLDFVLLFVPVEGAYITMMQAERNLWQYAYKKRVLLMSATNLIAAMKLVYDMWKREGISQNAQEIAEKAVKIYEKLSSFVEDFEKVGSQMEKATATFKDAQKKLYTGRGNVISQASQMKHKLSHNKPVRTIPAELEELGLINDQQPTDEDPAGGS